MQWRKKVLYRLVPINADVTVIGNSARELQILKKKSTRQQRTGEKQGSSFG